MKKLLGIVVLGLLLSGCASITYVSKDVQEELINKSTIKIGMKYHELVDIVGYDIYGWSFPIKNTDKKYLMLASRYPTDYAYLFHNDVNEKSGAFHFGKYTLKKIFENRVKLLEHVLTFSNIHPKDEVSLSTSLSNEKRKIEEKNEQKQKQILANKSEAEKIQIELASMINKAKNTCKTLGFEEGTDKFTDCALKLYSQEVENKVAIKVAEQKSSNSSNSGTMTIYDPVRDSQNQIDRGMKMLSGGCTLGIDC